MSTRPQACGDDLLFLQVSTSRWFAQMTSPVLPLNTQGDQVDDGLRET